MSITGPELRPTDFRADPSGATDQINAWADEHTQGKIPQAVPPGAITTDTKVTLGERRLLQGSVAGTV